jgi:hypothetical protein
MPASYPGSLKTSFGNPRIDLQSVVVANDVNPVYEEIVAIEKHLGIDINKRAANWGAAAYSTTSTTWTDLRTRLENAENGVFSSIQTTGGGVITNGTGSNGVSVTAATLTLRAASGQASMLLACTDNSSTLVAGFTPDGKLIALSIDGGTPATTAVTSGIAEG